MNPPPSAPHRLQISVDMPADLIAHLNRRAQQQLCSRAAYLRSLILADMAATR